VKDEVTPAERVLGRGEGEDEAHTVGLGQEEMPSRVE